MTNFYFFHLLIKIKTFEKNHIDFYIFENFVKKCFFVQLFLLIFAFCKHLWAPLCVTLCASHWEHKYSKIHLHPNSFLNQSVCSVLSDSFA